MCTVNKTARLWMMAAACLVTQQAFALSALELQKRLEDEEKLTIIDVRNIQAYTDNHIPGAINIPALIMQEKKLPPLGNVVVYGDGIDTIASEAAVEALNQKEGIQAEILEGGMPAWLSLSFPGSRPAGMTQDSERYISYQDLEKYIAADSDIVLVDLRLPKPDQVLTDIAEQIADAQVIYPAYRDNSKDKRKSPFKLGNLIRRQQRDTLPLYVLIDNGDEMSEKIYRRLLAAGVKRVAILAGGELILSNQGQSGQQQRTISSGDVQ